jgi:DNA replication and repair protein RecF
VFLKRLELVQFKNHRQLVFDFSQKINIFIGKNGIGKTNILDAIYYLSVFRSHLQSADLFNICHGHGFFRLLGQFSDNYDMVIKYALRQKSIEIKGVKVTKYSEYFGHLPLVLSSPSDIFLLHDGSEERRKLLDYTISIYDKIYLTKLNEYNHFLDQRNAHLKTSELIDHALLSYYDENLVALGSYIFEQRKKAIRELGQCITKWYQAIALSDENITITYSSQLIDHDYLTLLRRRHEKDKILKRSTVGIHRDDLKIEMSEVDIKKIASQGQQKSLLYSLRIAQAEFMASKTSKNIIFLLDDFSDKLDETRRMQLLNLMQSLTFIEQWFITDTSPASFVSCQSIKIWEIN